MSLERYIKQCNRITRAGGPRLRLFDIYRLTDEDVQQLAEQLALDLMPESLTCNGELQGSALVVKRAMLNQAATELRQMGQEVCI